MEAKREPEKPPTSDVLPFVEGPLARLLTTTQRIIALEPQIDQYRADKFGWALIWRSLVAAGIPISGVQQLKNLWTARRKAPRQKQVSAVKGLEAPRSRSDRL